MAATTILSFVVLIASGILTYALYNIYLHPLRHFPGPKLWCAFQWPLAYAGSTGQLPYKVLAFHRRYGTAVRVGPNELAFADPQAWQDIYGLQPGRVQNPKNKLAYPAHDPESDDKGILFGTDAGHAKARRALGPGFTPSAARELGAMIERYADLLVKQLGKAVEGQEVQDVSEWFEWTTFDIMGDFAFGESFKCLETTTSHLFVRVLFEGHDLGVVLGQLERYKVWTMMQKVLPKSFFKTLEELDALLTALTRKRQQQGHIAGHADIYNYLLENKSAESLTFEELKGNTWTLIFAGADTTATVLIFGSWALCKNPEVMKKVQAEVRGAFKDSSEINASSVNELKYMIAVLTEIMRMFPPGPSGLSRFITSPAGQSVAGHHVPHGTSCAIYQLSAFRLGANFTRPEEFIPERWLNGAPAEFANDRHDIYQPFSFGPRNCIGKPIAYVEMRILMAKWLYNFSFELADPDFDWLSTKKANSAWNNGGLKVRLRPAVNS